MKTQDIINLDFRKNENKEIIQKALVRIKPLAKFSEQEVPLEALEKVIRVLTAKYAICPQYITFLPSGSTGILYSAGIKRSDTHEWLSTVYGICLYELFAKLVIQMYSYTKNGTVKAKETK